jgi:hypothetical protein
MACFISLLLCPITWSQCYPVPCIAVDFIYIFSDLEFFAALHAAEIHGLSADYKPEFSIAFFALHCIFNIPYIYDTIEFA